MTNDQRNYLHVKATQSVHTLFQQLDLEPPLDVLENAVQEVKLVVVRAAEFLTQKAGPAPPVATPPLGPDAIVRLTCGRGHAWREVAPVRACLCPTCGCGWVSAGLTEPTE